MSCMGVSAACGGHASALLLRVRAEILFEEGVGGRRGRLETKFWVGGEETFLGRRTNTHTWFTPKGVGGFQASRMCSKM